MNRKPTAALVLVFIILAATQANAQAERASQMSTYNRATGACMEGRGYAVK